MEDHQWHLATEDGLIDFLFGTADTGIQTTHAPDLGQRSVITRDREMVREDGTAFGTDYEEGTLLTFECNVLTTGWAEQSDLLNAFRAAWSDRKFRKDPDAYAVMSVHNAGRTRLCYGRPRRFAEADSDLTHEGYTGVVCDFATRDGKFYGTDIHSTQVAVKQPDVVGFTTPIVTSGIDDPGTPQSEAVAFQTLQVDEDYIPGAMIVGGAETWPWIEFHGPVTNPTLILDGTLRIGLNTTLADGEIVTLDPRPWARRVVRDDGANLAGTVKWETPPMGQWLLQPGSYEVIFEGSDPTNTSFAIVNWREAFHRP